MYWLFFICHLAHADRFVPQTIPKRFQLKVFPHGPDGPLPDEGFEFEDDADGSNWLGKFGLLSIVTGLGLGTMYLLSEEASKNTYLYGGIGSLGAGVGLILVERAF